jgi:hypothetical protein
MVKALTSFLLLIGKIIYLIVIKPHRLVNDVRLVIVIMTRADWL